MHILCNKVVTVNVIYFWTIIKIVMLPNLVDIIHFDFVIAPVPVLCILLDIKVGESWSVPLVNLVFFCWLFLCILPKVLVEWTLLHFFLCFNLDIGLKIFFVILKHIFTYFVSLLFSIRYFMPDIYKLRRL